MRHSSQRRDQHGASIALHKADSGITARARFVLHCFATHLTAAREANNAEVVTLLVQRRNVAETRTRLET